MSNHGLPPHLDPRGRHRGGHSGGAHALRPVGRIVGSLVSIALLVVAGVVWYQYRDLNNNVTRLQVQLGAQQNTSGAKDIDGKDQNILLVGNDDRNNMTDKEVKELHVGRDGGSLATDTMLIVHIPANGAKATLISLPRDTQVDVPGYGMNKLNAPYALAYSKAMGESNATTEAEKIKEARTAGANLLIKTITQFTGLNIDHYVQIDLLGFYRLAQAIGGVPVTLCKDVDDRHSTNVANGSDGGSGLHLSAGHHVLDAKQALEFVRQRHNLPNGDFDRVKRQQYFLTAAFRQVASVGVLTKINQLSDALRRSVFFDGSLNLLDLAKQLENLTANNITGKTIPVNIVTGYSNPEKVKAFVQEVVATTNASAGTAPSIAPAPSSASSAPSSAPTSATASTSAPAIDAKCIN